MNFEILIEKAKYTNTKDIAVYISYDFECCEGYQVFVCPNSHIDLKEPAASELSGYLEVVARKIFNKEKAIQIGTIFAMRNNICFGGDISPLH